MAYDADCGPCTRFRHFVHRIDRKHEVEFVSLIDADDAGLLDTVPESERHTAFHVILPHGELLTGSDAVPSLLELLPGGKLLSKIVRTVPGGRLLVSIVYSGFARGHNGSACRYPRPVAGVRTRTAKATSVDTSLVGPTRSAYVLTGMVGGLFGSLAMGLAVRLPDALCVLLATALVGRSAVEYPLAWGFHVLTAIVVGLAFGALASVIRIRGEGAPGRALLLGLATGIVVWAGFFAPLMLTFLPQLVTKGLLGSSFVAHLILGLILGLALAVRLKWGGPQPAQG